MKTKICPRHHDMTRKLMLGLLDDAEALQTEELLRECPDCASSYEEEFSGADFEIVQQGVSQALASCTLPSRRKSRRWVGLSAMAAAATLMLAGGLHWARQQSHSPASMEIAAPNIIARIDFEQPNTEFPGGMSIHVETTKAQPEFKSTKTREKKKSKLFSNGAEDGSLKGWSLHT